MKFFWFFQSLLALALVTHAQAQNTVKQEFTAAKGESIELDLPYAKFISVEGWDQQKVVIEAEVTVFDEKTSKGYTLEVDRVGDKHLIRSELDLDQLPSRAVEGEELNDLEYQPVSISRDKDGNWRVYRVDVVYRIRAPKDTPVQIDTHRGNVEIKSMLEAITVETNNGFIDVTYPSNAGADLSLKTHRGNIYTDFPLESKEASESNRHCHSSIVVKTQLNEQSGVPLKLFTSCGDIYFRKG